TDITMSFPLTIHFPTILKDWPAPRRLNPHNEWVTKESNAWMDGFSGLPADRQSLYRQSMWPLLASLMYPDATREHLRLAADLMLWFVLYDEISDVLLLGMAQNLTDEVVKVLRYSRSNYIMIFTALLSYLDMQKSKETLDN
ncbi:hypothetical protein M422DRAFT_192674, partial [Sphaerobolus stellatus SS14]